MTLTLVRCRKGLHALTDENTKPGGGCRACGRQSDRRRANLKAGRHPREVLLAIPNAPLRERYLNLLVIGEVTASEVARAMDWWAMKKGRRTPDTSRVKRTLGLAEAHTRRVIDGVKVDTTHITQTIEYETAARLTLVLGVDPPAVGV